MLCQAGEGQYADPLMLAVGCLWLAAVRCHVGVASVSLARQSVSLHVNASSELRLPAMVQTACTQL